MHSSKMGGVSRAVGRAARGSFIAIPALASLAASGCFTYDCRIHSETATKDVLFDGITYRGGTEVNFGERCEVLHGFLAADSTINGIRYRGGADIHFFPQDEPPTPSPSRFRSGVLASDTAIQGVTYKGGTRLRFTAKPGKSPPCPVESGVLAADRDFDGILFPAGTGVVFTMKRSNRARGGAKSCNVVPYGFRSAQDRVSESGAEHPVTNELESSLYPFGLKPIGSHVRVEPVPGLLTTDLSVQGVFYKRGTAIAFYQNGGVQRATLVADTTIAKITYQGRSSVSFHKEGHVRSGILADNTTIDSPHIERFPHSWNESMRALAGSAANHQPVFAAGTSVEFHPDGQLASGTLVFDTVFVEPYSKYVRGTKIEFYENGSVKRGTLAADTTAQCPHIPSSWDQSRRSLGTTLCQPVLAAGTSVEFYPDGGIASGVLASDTFLLEPAGRYLRGTRVDFHSNGLVKRGTLADGPHSYPDPNDHPPCFSVEIYDPPSVHKTCYREQRQLGPYGAGTTVEFDVAGNLIRAVSEEQPPR